MITTIFASIKDCANHLKAVFIERYHISGVQLQNSLVVLTKYLTNFREDLYVLIEHPYVDKVYRDSYYNYYASKNQQYERDCVKISLFESDISPENFKTLEEIEKLQNLYMGFLVIRPTFPHVIGRSFIDPRAIKENDFKICLTTTSTTANGVKFMAKGFPHSSQNTETIACAETTIWSIMEYFGMRYPEYTPTLPSKISAILNNYSFERLLPSKGLRADQISYAIKQLGFGVKLYNNKVFAKDFLILLRMYIESGIPVIVAVENKSVGHAQCVIGRRKFNDDDVNGLDQEIKLSDQINVIDLESMKLDYVFIDDNFPPYKISELETPTSFYSQSNWLGCSITNFIVPLYSKIYLDASVARAYVGSFLKNYISRVLPSEAKHTVILRVFLASSRTYKDYCRKNDTMDSIIKELIVVQKMPKFIWVAELSTKELVKKNYVNGLLLLDATETKDHCLIAGFFENMYFTNTLNEFVQIKLPLQPFKNFNENLQ